MKLLLENIKLLSEEHPLHGKEVYLAIDEGIISSVSERRPKFSGTAFNASGYSCSIGWMDMQAALNEPGFEYRETIAQLCEVAALGGFTDVAVQPNTQPVMQHKEGLLFLKHQQGLFATNLHPLAAATVDVAGKEITEMFDLHQAGALAFSDGQQPMWHTGVLLRALQYLQNFNGLLIVRPENLQISAHGHMHEGIASTKIGTRGMPAIAENIAVNELLYLLEYYGGRAHVANISSAESVSLIRKGKANGLPISCDVAAHQLCFTDEDLLQFNTNLKVNPPFRTQADIDALLAGLADGTIDSIVSAHTPHDVEHKELEFDLADFGAIGLETAFSAAFTATADRLGLPTLLHKFTVAPRQILNLPIPKIEAGAAACLTVFDEAIDWEVSATGLTSPCKNSPFLGKTLKSRPMGIVNGKQFHFSDTLMSRQVP